MTAPGGENPALTTKETTRGCDNGNGGSGSVVDPQGSTAPVSTNSPETPQQAVYDVLAVLAGSEHRQISTTISTLGDAAGVTPREALISLCALDSGGRLRFEPTPSGSGVVVTLAGESV